MRILVCLLLPFLVLGSVVEITDANYKDLVLNAGEPWIIEL